MKFAGLMRGMLMMLALWLALPLQAAQPRQTINALYLPLADHYAALVAYERYRDQMQYADFQIRRMRSWDLLRAYFRSGRADMAFMTSPMAMDMFYRQPDFRWVGLMHRDGNALAINHKLAKYIGLTDQRIHRKPDKQLANAFRRAYQVDHQVVLVGVPHLLSTHTVVLSHYLQQHQLDLGLKINRQHPVLAVSISPADSPVFIKAQANRHRAAI